MTTPSRVLTADEQPSTLTSRSNIPTTGMMLGRTCANWALVAVIMVSALIGLENDFGIGHLASSLVMAVLGFAFVSLGDGLVSLLWKILGFLLTRLQLASVTAKLWAASPTMIGRLLGVFFYIASDLLWPESFFQHILIPPVGELFIMLFAITGVLVTWARLTTGWLWLRVGLVGTAVLLNLAYLIWVIQPGTDTYLAHAPTAPASALALSNPGLSGPYAVQTLTYGSGAVTNRSEFSQETDLLTQPVDGSPIFEGYSGLGGSYFHWYWDFDFTYLPLNALVWYPQGEGPFPLVLIVHGNHAMTDSSDPGYAYLAEHLASHGYIVASVDENFLNGNIFVDGAMTEMPLRAWLLLKHLQQWRTWNQTAANPFYGQVDLNHIALIGHSRGGEAVAAAAEMNWRVAPPVSRVSSADEFGFGIEAVVAIAPSDDHYKPNGRSLTIPHSSYLLLAGGHDADTYVLYGQAQYNRVRFMDNPDGFKALAYVYQANHGQFNTAWADRDRGWLNSLLLNRRPLLSPTDQQVTAQVLITAFLEASLHGQDGYRALFSNPAAGNPWLPDIIIVTQYESAHFMPIDTNMPNSAASRIDNPNGQTWAEGMTTWQTKRLMLRDGTTSQRNSALYLAWEAGSEPIVAIELGGSMTVTVDDALTFALTSAMDEDVPIEVTIELETADHQTTQLPLSQFAPIYPPLPAQLVKANWLAPLPGYKINLETPYERILQTFTIPLVAFQQANPSFQPDKIETIRFFFDGTKAGAVYVDQVGFVQGN